MNIWWLFELILESLRTLCRHKLRSTLTLLGVIFGVAAVIAMMAVGEGAQRTVLQEISGLGLRNIIAESVRPSESSVSSSASKTPQRTIFQYGLTFQDLERLSALFPKSDILVTHPVHATSYFQAKAISAAVIGAPPEYFDLFGTHLIEGRLLTATDEENIHRVAIISEPVARTLAMPGGIVGQKIHIGKKGFEVVGVAGVPSPGAEGKIFIPYRTAAALFGTVNLKIEAGKQEITRNAIAQIIIRLDREEIVPEAARVANRVLKEYHTANDFQMTVPMDLLMTKQRTQHILNMVLIVIAAISLLVGGIGIMNIMLATVSERIPEIGVRRALGASRRDILWQFTTEAVVLSTLGGLLGCLLGYALAPSMAGLVGWVGVFTPGAILTALFVSWLIGVIFGLAPAIRAARLDPVACLRHE